MLCGRKEISLRGHSQTRGVRRGGELVSAVVVQVESEWSLELDFEPSWTTLWIPSLNRTGRLGMIGLKTCQWIGCQCETLSRETGGYSSSISVRLMSGSFRNTHLVAVRNNVSFVKDKKKSVQQGFGRSTSRDLGPGYIEKNDDSNNSGG
jgi:hypothetical protein